MCGIATGGRNKCRVGDFARRGKVPNVQFQAVVRYDSNGVVTTKSCKITILSRSSITGVLSTGGKLTGRGSLYLLRCRSTYCIKSSKNKVAQVSGSGRISDVAGGGNLSSSIILHVICSPVRSNIFVIADGKLYCLSTSNGIAVLSRFPCDGGCSLVYGDSKAY